MESHDIQHEVEDAVTGEKLKVITREYQGGIAIIIEGYQGKFGDETIYLDYFDGVLQLLINNNIDNEEPEIINMEKARTVEFSNDTQ